MRDQRKSNERYRRRKVWGKIYMGIASGTVFAVSLYGIIQSGVSG